MRQENENFRRLTENLTPAQLERKAALLEFAIAQVLLCATPQFRDKLVKRSYDKWRSKNNPLAMLCVPSAEAHFNILGGYRHLEPMKSYDPYRYKPRQKNPMHRYVRSRYSAAIYDPTKQQYTTRGLEPPYEGGKSKPFGSNSFPAEKARMVIHELAARLRDDERGREIFGADFRKVQRELLPIVEAAAAWWPLREQRKKLGITFWNKPTT